MNFDDFRMVKITKKVDIMKKKQNFLKVKVITHRLTKYELRTPRELQAIEKPLKKRFCLTKTFFP